MKHCFIFFLCLTFSLAVGAVPAQRGIWKTVTLADGSKVQAELRGDEHMHYYQTADGTCLLPEANGAVAVSRKQIAAMHQVRQREARRVILGQEHEPYVGKRKGLIILMNFADKAFADAHTLDFYKCLANEQGFDYDDFVGSVKDYFFAQSNGLFELDFDVVGPFTAKNNFAYYGSDDGTTLDVRAEELIMEACLAADNEVNFADYDWDDDGEVEQVFVLYAGQGQAGGGSAETIWPRESRLSVHGSAFNTNDGKIVDTYACSSELNKQLKSDGIGTICHEFSHCLGIPDMYDTRSGGNFGMGNWDLMDGGSYNGNGRIPAGYTSYERMYCGWLQPVWLRQDTIVGDMKALCEGGDSYIIYNNDYRREFYLLENRQPSGWDAALPGSGLLVLHVDFDADIWKNNLVNTTGMGNVYERCTVVHADGDAGTSADSQANDVFPWQNNNQLTDTSMPSWGAYHSNALDKSVTNITQNADGTIGFSFVGVDDYVESDALLKETFSNCNGQGGNDGLWNGDAGNGQFMTDVDGWTCQATFGADKCAKLGSRRTSGAITSPSFNIDGTVELSFRAAPWDEEQTSVSVTVSGDATITPTDFILTAKQWTDCTATITGSGDVQLTFTPSNNRFFLDEIEVRNEVSGIRQIDFSSPVVESYDLQGRKVGPSVKGVKIEITQDGQRRKVVR